MCMCVVIRKLHHECVNMSENVPNVYIITYASGAVNIDFHRPDNNSYCLVGLGIIKEFT